MVNSVIETIDITKVKPILQDLDLITNESLRSHLNDFSETLIDNLTKNFLNEHTIQKTTEAAEVLEATSFENQLIETLNALLEQVVELKVIQTWQFALLILISALLVILIFAIFFKAFAK